MKYILLGGFDYAIRFEMNADAIYNGIDYFVDVSDGLQGSTYMGKPIYGFEHLIKDTDEKMILIGSIIFHTDLEFLLRENGYVENLDYMWAPNWKGNEECPRLWYHREWKDNEKQKIHTEADLSVLDKYRIVARLIDEDVKYIIELGAANERIREFLKTDVNYYPVDYIQYSDSTIVCDLNADEFPEIETDRNKTCILCVGTLHFFFDWKDILRKSMRRADTIIVTHNDFVRINRDYRREYSPWNSCFFNHELILFMQSNGYYMTEAYDFRLRVVIMKFKKLEG